MKFYMYLFSLPFLLVCCDENRTSKKMDELAEIESSKYEPGYDPEQERRQANAVFLHSQRCQHWGESDNQSSITLKQNKIIISSESIIDARDLAALDAWKYPKMYPKYLEEGRYFEINQSLLDWAGIKHSKMES